MELRNSKNGLTGKVSLEQFKSKLAELEGQFKNYINKLHDMQIDLLDAANTVDKAIALIPALRKGRARLKFETAVISYKDKLAAAGINQVLLSQVIKKRRAELNSKRYDLSLENIYEIESRLGIGKSGSSEENGIFEVFRGLLGNTGDLDEIEAILRRVRLNLKQETGLKTRLMKEEIVWEFVNSAAFDEKPAVSRLLINRKLAEAVKKDVVTEARLSKELNRIEGGFSEVSKKLLNRLDRRLDEVRNILDRELPLSLRIFSNYLVNPVAGTAGVMGTLVIIVYVLGEYVPMLFSNFYPRFSDNGGSAFEAFIRMLNPQSVFLFGFGSMFIGGLIKMLDDKMRKKVLDSRLDLDI